MKELKKGLENCIETPTSCSTWNGGDIEALGICNGDSLNNVVWEIVDKLKDIGGEDISSFDIDTLLDICNAKAPLEITLVSILTIIKENQVCLKDYIDTLNNKINELSGQSDINVNLKCYADIDNLGNQLAITREELDQLVINELCDHEQQIKTLQGKVLLIEEEVANIDPHATVDELSFSTCIDAGVKPTSQQVVKVADALCTLRDATGTAANIAQALSKIPSNWNTKYNLLTGWDLTPDNLAQTFGNLLLVIANLEERLANIENNCCAISCEDVKLGFSVLWSEDKTSVILTFNSGSGTKIPEGFVDKGSTGTITDKNGNVISFNVAISLDHEEEVYITGLDTSGPLLVHIDAQMGNDSITCGKCLDKTVTSSTGCAYCELTATGDDDASAVIVYYTTVNSFNPVPASTTTTTTVSV